MQNYDMSIFVDKFIEDANNLLNELETKLLELEQDKTDKELIESVFRVMHTLKGIGSMFGFNHISEYTHHLETIYDKIRQGILSIDTSIFQITFTSVDHLRNLLADQNLKNPEIAERHNDLTKDLVNFVETRHIKDLNPTEIKILDDKKSDNITTWYIQFFTSEELIRRAINIVYLFQDLANIGTFSVFKHNQNIEDGITKFEEVWGILLKTSASYDEIESIFMFATEFVKIVKFNDENKDVSNNVKIGKDANKSIFDLAKNEGESIEKKFETPEEKVELKILSTKEREQHNSASKIPRISVGADKLDKLMYLVSELFTTRSELVMATQNTDMARIKIAVEKIDKLSSQFRNNALSIRLVPLRELSLKFKRLIRDLSIQLGKNIEFEIQGEDTELDKNLVDSLADPFMHIIRNCIDHGIESPERRRENNKSEVGVIKIVAYQSGNYIYIQISDDGKGIDTEFIRNKAIEKKFIPANSSLSKKEILDLIFLPGFSTAESLTQVSGRGVGMDVVKRSINQLRGSIEIESEINAGTTFTIKLQQTISIMDSLLIRVGKMYFTIILEEVEVCGLEEHARLFNRQNNHLQIADDLIPFISLRNAFSIAGDANENDKIIVINRQHLRYAIVADDIIGQYQAVIKPLSAGLQNKEFISGASIMGDGNIAFMLDTQKLSFKLN